MRLSVIILIACLALFNLAYFAVKTTQVVAEHKRRNADIASEFVQQYIPRGSKVIGDPLYYYAVTENGSSYHYYDLYNTLEKREAALRQQYDYDYMIVSGVSLARNPSISEYFLSKAKLDSVASLNIPQSKIATVLNKLGIISSMEASGYNCTLYKRVK